MTKSKSLTIFLVISMLLIAFSGNGATQNAQAQPQQPPTLSSQGETPQIEPLAEPFVGGLEPGPATDEYIPEEALTGEVTPPSEPIQGFGTESDAWIGSMPHGARVDSPQSEMGIQTVVLWDNGPLVTHPGGGYNGNDASVLQTALSLSSYGLSVSYNQGYRMADDFSIPAGSGWKINEITFYPYQTGTFSYPPSSTLTGVYLQIWNGSPDNPSSSVVYGDLVTNRLIDTYWTNIYRVLDTALTNTDRPVMAAVVDVNTTLSPGDYWLVWTVSGSLGSGPWSPPISILGQTITGNALQYSASTAAWTPANDTGLLTQQGMPFVIEGATGDWLWDQPQSTVNTGAYVDQEIPDYPTYTSYLADDFVVNDVWKIDSIYIPGDGWNSFTSLLNATALNWKIYTDAGGFPAGDPSGVGAPPVWSLSLPPSDPNVTLSNGYLGYLSNTLLDLPSPLKLGAGHYWLVFYPTLTFGLYGQFGLHPADTNNGNVAKFINPGGGFGYGTVWQDWNNIGAPSHDFAFSIGGTAGYYWKSIASINSTGRGRPAAAVVNGKIYLFGGEITGGGRADTVERYDPSSNTWTTQVGLMPYPASNICAAVIGTDIYIPGGYDASAAYLSTLQIYHTTTGTWSTLATDPLPAVLAGAGCAATGGKLYVFGGNSNNVYQSGAYVYDPAAAAGSRWTTLASMANARGYLAGVVSNGKIYAIGGREASVSDFNYVEAYDPADGLWHPVTGMQHGRGGVGAYAVGDTIYACGGGWTSYLDSCESYDTTLGYDGAWSSHPATLIQGRRTFGYANIGPTLYAIAGYNGSYLATAERWAYESYLPITMNKPFTNLGFDSQFNGNADGWSSQSGFWYFDSENLYTYGLDSLWSSANYDQVFGNLDYSARMMRLGCIGCSSNLIIRGTPAPLSADNKWNKQYIFQVSGDRYFSIFKISGSSEVALQFWTYSDAILPLGNWNTLRVFANGPTFYFTINGTLVWSGTDSTFAAGLVGVSMFGSVDAGDELLVDWATLYTDVGTMGSPGTISPEQQLLNDAAKLTGGGVVTGHQVP